MKQPLFISVIDSQNLKASGNQKNIYIKMAKLWVDLAYRSGITNYLIYCADNSSFEKLQSCGLKAKRIFPEKYEFPKCILNYSKRNKPPDYMLGQNQATFIHFKTIAFLKLVAIEDALRNSDGPIIMSDIDAFIQRNPNLAICELFKDFDILLSTETSRRSYPSHFYSDFGFTLCSGWFGVKGGSMSLNFIQDLKMWKSNSNNLQYELNHYIFNQAKIAKGDDTAAFAINNIKFKCLEQSFVSRAATPQNSYIHHFIGNAEACVERGIHLKNQLYIKNNE
jgi:hypothetical protein